MRASARYWLTGMLLACGLAAAPVQANVTVSAEGTDSGDNPNDTLRITGEDSHDSIIIREGFEGDVGPGGEPDSCGGNDTLCFLTVESTNPITTQGACQLDGADTKARCAYFHSDSARSGHTYQGRINLLGGANDRVQIIQDAVRDCCQALTTPWNWAIDYGAGNDVIDGPTVLTVPDSRGTVNVTLAGGAGSDLFRGPFAARPTTLLGDDINGAVNVTGTDIFSDIPLGIGMSIQGQGGDDQITPLSTAIPIDAGPGNDVVSLRRAAFDTLGPPAVLDGGSGTDGLGYGLDSPALTILLDGSGTSTGNNTMRNFENVTGSPHGDTLIGNGQPNKLTGGGGRGDSLKGLGGDDTLDIDDGTTGPPGRGVDDTAEGGAGEDLILSNDGVRDVADCGTSSHSLTVFIDNRATQLSIFDSDRARLDLDDVQRDCEDVQREPVRTAPAAQIARATLAGDNLRLTLRCPRSVRGGCRGSARAEAAGGARRRAGARGAVAVRYRVRAGAGGAVRVPLPRAVLTKLARPGFAVARAVLVEKDARRRNRTRSQTVLLHRR